MKLRTTSVTLLVLGSATLAFAACGDDTETGTPSGGGDPVELTLEAKDELFPGFSYDTGLLPDASPVKASFTVSASGETTVSATCAVSGSKAKPVLTGLPDGGAIVIDGGFAMVGRLVVEGVPAIDDYDGEIPGLENVVIDVVGEGAFDPFAIGDAVSATADIPEADLPAIPLGAVPGELQLHVGAGSFVEIGWSGTCAGIDGEEATYAGTIVRSGKLVIEPKIVIDALIDTLEFEIPSFEIDLALGSTNASASAEVEKFGGAPSKGEKVDEACEGSAGQGGNGQGGGAASGSSTSTMSTSSMSGSGVTTGGATCETPAQCGGFPCVEGTCGDGTGLCESGLTTEDDALDACVTANCCDALAACTLDYGDVAGCNACMDAGGGARCDAYIGCTNENCNNGAPVCDSGLSFASTTLAECAGASCCDDFNDCTQQGADPQACIDCFDEGNDDGSFGPLCNAASACLQANCTGYGVCDSGIALTDPMLAECLGESCCTELNDCTQQGTDVQSCIDCLNADDFGELCNDAVLCWDESCT